MTETTCSTETCLNEALPQNGVICRCLSVTVSEVQTAISVYNATSVRELGRCTGAGKGCMACHGRLKALIANTK